MSSETEQHIFEAACDLVDELETIGIAPDTIDGVLLALVVARGRCSEAIKALSPQGLAELHAAVNEATAECL